jgi:hypothetical protein
VPGTCAWLVKGLYPLPGQGNFVDNYGVRRDRLALFLFGAMPEQPAED